MITIRFLLSTLVMLCGTDALLAETTVYGQLSKSIYGSIKQRIVPERITNCSMCSRTLYTIRRFLENHPILSPPRDGIYRSEVSRYRRQRDKLKADFYDGLLVRYHDRASAAAGEMRIGVATVISELVPDEVEIDGKRVAIEDISGVLIWNHRDYRRSVRTYKQDTELLYTHTQTEAAVTEYAQLYGEIVGIFTDNYLALRVDRALIRDANNKEQYWRFDNEDDWKSDNDTVYTVAKSHVSVFTDINWPDPPPR